MSEPERPHLLTQLNIFLENSCSLACRSCQNLSWTMPGSNGNGHKKRLTVEAIVQAVQEAQPMGLQTVRLTGGETLLYPGFDTLLDQIERLELGLIIETNGSGLTATRAARIAHLPQSQVAIGLDASGPVIHDALNDRQGSFETAKHAIRMLADAGRAAQIFFMVSRQNAGQIVATIRLAELLGAASIRFISSRSAGPVSFSGKNGSQPASVRADTLTIEELIALGRKVERDLANTTRLRLSVDLPPAFRGLHPQAHVEGQGRCAVLKSLAVLPGGEYALCGGAAGVPALMFGQVGSDPLEQIWQTHPTLAALREALPGQMEGICGRCIMKTACLGYCAVENYLRSGSFSEPNGFCQAAEHVGLFPAGRLIENLLW